MRSLESFGKKSEDILENGTHQEKKRAFIVSCIFRLITTLQTQNTSKPILNAPPVPYTQSSTSHLLAYFSSQSSTMYLAYLYQRDKLAQPKNLYNSKCAPFPLL